MDFNNIATCTNCELHKNQKALLDKPIHADIFWLGLSAKKVENINDSIPLNSDTNTGKIIKEIETRFSNLSFYKSNLVKCLPLNGKKLRYPTQYEINACKQNFICELLCIRPKLVFCLGQKVFNSIKDLSNLQEFSFCKFIHIEHPSYIYVYKRKFLNDYIEKVSNLIKNEYTKFPTLNKP